MFRIGIPKKDQLTEALQKFVKSDHWGWSALNKKTDKILEHLLQIIGT